MYAHWTNIVYTITYDMNGHGEEPANLKYLYTVDDTPYAPSDESEDPTDTGYVFMGWAPERIEQGDVGNKKFIATWRPCMYHIRYDGNNETSGMMPDETCIYDQPMNLRENAFKRQYTITYVVEDEPNQQEVVAYEFQGWTMVDGGEASAFKDKAEVLNLTAQDDGVVELHAVWKPTSTILPTRSRYGYQFNGWYDAAFTDGGGDTPPATTEDDARDALLKSLWTAVDKLRTLPAFTFEPS